MTSIDVIRNLHVKVVNVAFSSSVTKVRNKEQTLRKNY